MDIDDAKRAMTYVMQKEAVTLPPLEQGDVMTGFDSKRQAAQAKLQGDDAQGYIADHEAALKIAYEAWIKNGKQAQPEQEPVAYYHPHKGFYWAKPTHISAPTVVDVPPVPLYVKWIAAQRPWVGLTDDEIDIVYQGAGKHDLLNARDIEAKLKERNT
jgi:hypothetical protein